MLTATIFDVVHGSFVDGWGIRTTVFFKGCPLRCKWCCNPESQETMPQLQVVKEHCSRCGACLSVCPKQALTLVGNSISVNRSLCDNCGKCVPVCWPEALAMWGKTRTVESVFQECVQDKAFYEQSGGGVTLSGGEPTLQAEFCLELVEKCHHAGISVAVDTCGQVSSPAGLELLRKADLILFDVKGIDGQRHQANTGVDNHIIQHNLKLLDEWNKDVIIRYPVIPHHNQNEAEEIASLLSTLSCVRRVDLIAYHPYGVTKYEQLGRKYSLEEDAIPSETQQKLVEMFRSYGLKTQLGG